jgi:hypothetical protein
MSFCRLKSSFLSPFPPKVSFLVVVIAGFFFFFFFFFNKAKTLSRVCARYSLLPLVMKRFQNSNLFPKEEKKNNLGYQFRVSKREQHYILSLFSLV